MQFFRKASSELFILLLLVMLSVISLQSLPELYNAHMTSLTIAFMFSLAGLLVIYALWLIVRKPQGHFEITVLDVALVLYFILTILNRYVFHSTQTFSLPFVEMIGLSLFYFLLRTSYLKKKYSYILLALVVSGIIQSVIGNLQLHGYQASRHAYFLITGTFFNPGPYAGYLAIVLPVAIGLYLYRKNLSDFLSLSDRLKWLKPALFTYLPIVGLFAVLSVLPATRSRAAWVAGIIGVAYILLSRSEVLGKLRVLLNSGLKKGIAAVLIVLLLAGSALGLYFFKQDSANGRMLIWKVTTSMIGDNLVAGVGYDRFKSEYMIYQAAYFKDYQNEDEVWVAGDNDYAFNDFLQIGAEYGIPGLLLIILILFYILFQGNRKNELLIISKAGILSVVVFSLFSYPAQILPIKITLIVFLAIVSSHSQALFSFKWENVKLSWLRTGKVVLISVSILGAIGLYQYSVKLYNGLKDWYSAYDYYQMGVYDQAAVRYEKISHQFGDDGDFLTQYGKSLGFIGQTDKAIEVLKQATHHLNTTVICSSLGALYEQTGSVAAAEMLYTEAWYMVPNRFYAKYLLAELYHNAGAYERAYLMAKDLLTMKVKVESTAIQEIRSKAAELISKYE